MIPLKDDVPSRSVPVVTIALIAVNVIAFLYQMSLGLDEAGGGDPVAAAKRLDLLRQLPLLDAGQGTMLLADELIRRRLLPSRAATDAAHLAIATASRMDVLVTWNCAHLANADLLIGVGRFLRSRGFEPPLVCTPMELTGAAEDLEE